MVIVQTAEESDLERLRLCAISAFIYNEQYKPEDAKPGGPPGHDSIKIHFGWLKTHDYFKCMVHDKIAGGCIVKKHQNYKELFGIFLCRNFIGKGIGSKFLIGVMQKYPSESIWVLETPGYSKRNHHFYERNGFVFSKKIRLDLNLGYGFIVFKKHRPTSSSSGPGKAVAF